MQRTPTGKVRGSYQIDLFGVEVFREEGCPVENIAALVFWDLVKLGADQQQRHCVLSKLLSVIITEASTQTRGYFKTLAQKAKQYLKYIYI